MLEEGIGLLRQTKDTVSKPVEYLVLLYWFSTLEDLLAEKPDLSSPGPAAFIHLWCQLLAQGGALCCPGFSPGDAVWQAFQGVLVLWTVELRFRNSSTVWRRIQPFLQDDRQAAFHAIRLMEFF